MISTYPFPSTVSAQTNLKLQSTQVCQRMLDGRKNDTHFKELAYAITLTKLLLL